MAESNNKYIFLMMMMYKLVVASPLSSPFDNNKNNKSRMMTCHRELDCFVQDLKLQCPTSISFSPPIQMDGESLDLTLRSSPSKANTAVLFYASWCPFSSEIQSKFRALSSMFPQIKHVMVEESSALPSVFSRYGIHSFPSILMVNQTGEVLYHGSKDLPSLVHFYKRMIGQYPVVDLTKVQSSSARIGHKVLQPWNYKSLKEIFAQEPYLVISILFLFLKAFVYLFPEIFSRLKAVWVAYVPHPSLGVFGESSQLLGRVIHVIDVKRICNRLNLWKSRNFRDGARKARVWASSLASVSLGETSSARATSPLTHM